MVSLQDLARISEIEFSDIVDTTELIGIKLRVLLRKGGFIDIWQSRKLPDRFGFHWETDRRGLSFRYDNFPDSKWKHIPTYPYHFHDGSQDNVAESSQFEKNIEDGFRDFMSWVRLRHLSLGST